MWLRGALAENLRRLRNERGLSQEAFADLAEIDRTYVSALERQVYSATLDIVERLAEALEVAPVDLLTPAAVVTQDDATAVITIRRPKGRRRPSK